MPYDNGVMRWTSDDDRKLVQCERAAMSTREIAAALGMPEGRRFSVARRIGNLKATGDWDRIREELGEEAAGNPCPEVMTGRYSNYDLGDRALPAPTLNSPPPAANWQAVLERRKAEEEANTATLPRIPCGVVDAIVLTLTNDSYFFNEVIEIRHGTERPSAAIDLLVKKWCAKLWPKDVYVDGHEDKYKLTPAVKTLLALHVLSEYRDNFKRDDLDEWYTDWVVKQLVAHHEHQLMGVLALRTWNERGLRVNKDQYEHQIQVNLHIDPYCASIGLLRTDAGAKIVAIGEEDMRVIARKYRDATELKYIGRVLEGTETADYAGLETIADEYSSLAGHDNERSLSLGDEEMKADFDKDSVLETGEAHKKEHIAKRAALQQAAEASVSAYVAEAVKAVVAGNVAKAQKPLEIELAQDNTKRYDDALLMVRHVAGSVVPSCDEVVFLLAASDDTTPTFIKRVTVNVA